MQHDNQGQMWSKTAEEGNLWLRLLSAVRRDKARVVRRTGFVEVQLLPGDPGRTDAAAPTSAGASAPHG